MAHDEMALEEELARVPLRRTTWRRVFRYAAPYKAPIIAALVVEAVWVVSMLADVKLLKEALDGPVKRGDFAAALPWAGWLVANLIFRAAITVWELRITNRVGIDVISAIRRDVFDHVQRLSPRYFDRTKQGRIIARVDRDVDTLEHIIVWGPVIVVSLGFCMILGFAWLFAEHRELALLCIATVPVLFGITRLFEKFGFPAYRRVRETHSAISAHVAETITGVRVVKAFQAEDRELARLAELQARYRSAVLGSWRVAGAYIPVVTLVYHGLLVVVLWQGGNAMARGEIDAGGVLQLVMLLGMVLGPVEGLGGLYNEALVAGAAAERIFLLLDTTPDVKDGADAVDPGRLRGEVAFEDVSFAYDAEGKHGAQIRNVSFHVPAGKTVALVGHTGAGKTTVANLVARFYEAQSGVVRIDGHDVRKIRLDSLHRQLGIVLQESYLFAGTVLANLRFVRPEITDEEARAGFDALGCGAVRRGFAKGLDTDVGERGANLSEGERQVVCFVRALLARPTILILDEATSAVDTRTEALILEALRRLASRQTTFVIAHRLSTIREADVILVLDHGQVVEQGTHDELAAAGGAYARLYAEYGRAAETVAPDGLDMTNPIAG